MKSEVKYQLDLVKRIESRFPGCYVLVNDPDSRQGVPDLIVLFGTQWAMLEVKAHKRAPTQPNQPYYVDEFNKMSFAAFIYPENEEEVLDALQHTFRVGW